MTPARFRRQAGWGVAALVPLAFLGVFFVYPVGSVLVTGLTGEGAVGIGEVLGRGSFRSVLWFTFWQATVSTVATVVVALPMAHVVARYRFRGRAIVRALVTVPFVLPTVVVATAFIAFMDRFGLDEGTFRLRHTVWAVLGAHVFFNYAIVVRAVGGFWAQLDPRQEEAAQMLGANRRQVLWHVTLPRLTPALAAASAIVFLFSFTSFGVILLLGGPRRATLDTEIWRYATQRTELDVAAAIAVVQLVAVLALLVANSWLQRRTSTPDHLVVADHARPARSRPARLYLGTVLGSALVLLGSPIAVLVERSFGAGDGYTLAHYRGLATPAERVPQMATSALAALGNSLQFAAAATVMATVVGLLAAMVVARSGRRVATAFDVVMLTPLGTSAVIVGFGFLVALDAGPLDLRTSWWIIPLAQALIGVPFVVRAVAPVLLAIDARLREAATTLGASRWRRWLEVDLPLAARGIAVGAGFAFAVSLGEFGATSFIARADRPTVPVAIFRLLSRPGDTAFGQAMALAVILMAVTTVVVLVIERARTVAPGEI